MPICAPLLSHTEQVPALDHLAGKAYQVSNDLSVERIQMEIVLEESMIFKAGWIDKIILKHWISWLIGRNPVSVEVEQIP